MKSGGEPPHSTTLARAYMRSTYDRNGGNEGADASHFHYQISDTNNVSLDVAGPGCLYYARYNHWHGSPWHYVVDGTDHIVQETSTAQPTRPVADSVFLPPDLFPPPLVVTWSATKGADLSWVPIEFEQSFRMEYSRTHYGTGYYIYQFDTTPIALCCRTGPHNWASLWIAADKRRTIREPPVAGSTRGSGPARSARRCVPAGRERR